MPAKQRTPRKGTKARAFLLDALRGASTRDWPRGASLALALWRDYGYDLRTTQGCWYLVGREPEFRGRRYHDFTRFTMQRERAT